MKQLFSPITVYMYSVAIFIVSILPLKAPPPANFPMLDKWVHFFMYLLLSYIAINTAKRDNMAHPYIKVFSYGFLLGFIIECVQIYVPYRSFELADMLVNAVGAAAGLLFLQK